MTTLEDKDFMAFGGATGADQETGDSGHTCQNSDGVSSDAVTVDVIKFNVPPYTGKLRPWFTRLEAQFRAGKVKSAAVKFNVVIAQAPEHIVEQITEDEIEALSVHKDCYDRLKNLLLRRFTPSEDERLSNLLKGSTVSSGDRPSDIYRKIMLDAKGIWTEETVRMMWMIRLPPMIQMLLVNDAKLPLAELADKADQYFLKYKASHEVRVDAMESSNPFLSPHVAPSSSSDAPDPLVSISKALEKLTLEVCELKRSSRPTKFTRSSSRHRGRSATPGRSQSQNRVCWYHKKFGDKATDCRPPCSFRSAQGN